MDGKFYTKGRSVWKRPLRSPDGNVATIHCGFKVCQLDDYCPDEAAELIAKACNEMADRHAGCLCPHCNPTDVGERKMDAPQVETVIAQNARLRAELEAERSFVDRVWKALAIVDYAGAKGKAIDELVYDLRTSLKNIATQKTSAELKAEGEQEYDDADFEGGYDAIIHIARRAMQPT